MSSSDPYADDSHPEDPYRPPQIDTSVYRPTKDVAILQLAGTRTGLQLVYWGIVLILVAMVVMIISVIVMAALGGPGGAVGTVGIGIGAILLGLSCVVGGLMMFVGQCFCLTVPESTGAKGLVTTTVVIQVVNLLVGVGIGAATTAMGTANDPNPVFMGVQLLGGILGIVGFFCFLAFIKRVAQFIGRPDIAEYAGKVITVFGSIIGVYVLLIVMLVVATAGGAGALAIAGGCMGIVILILLIVGLCMYTTVLRNTAVAIGERMSGSADTGAKPGAPKGFTTDEFGA